MTVRQRHTLVRAAKWWRPLDTDKIGVGGMGEVYRAHDEHLDRDVALKLLPVGMLADDKARKRFRNEVLALSKLNHPNIAMIYDYVAEKSLAQKLATGPLPEKEAIALGGQIAEALEEAHEHNIIHRDLKISVRLRCTASITAPAGACIATETRPPNVRT